MAIKVIIRVDKYKKGADVKLFSIHNHITFCTFFNMQALVWVLTGMLAASLCSGLVQDCDNCDKVLNKL